MNIADLAPPQLDGAGILDALRQQLTSYVAMPSAEATDAVVLWIAATHGQPFWEHASRLVIKSPLKRCGKTRLLEVVAETAHRPLRTTNISTAALVRSINEDDPPTLILDEGDAIFAKRRGEASEKAEDLRGIVNSGHSRAWPYVRWDAAARRAEFCPTFAMVAIAAIGDLPDTIEDRAVIVAMRRRAAAEHVQPFRRRQSLAPLHEIRDALHAWVRGHQTLTDAQPAMPVDDRAADVWEALVAVADAAGGDWPARARAACVALTAAANQDADEGTAGERLLDDLRAIFGKRPAMFTNEILPALHDIDDGPWSDWFGKPLTARHLSRLLRPYGVRARQIRIGSASNKGYEAASLSDAWTRYRRSPETSETGKQDGSSASDSESETTLPECVSDRDAQSETQSETPRFGLFQIQDDGPERTDRAAVSHVSDVTNTLTETDAPFLCDTCGAAISPHAFDRTRCAECRFTAEYENLRTGAR